MKRTIFILLLVFTTLTFTGCWTLFPPEAFGKSTEYVYTDVSRTMYMEGCSYTASSTSIQAMAIYQRFIDRTYQMVPIYLDTYKGYMDIYMRIEGDGVAFARITFWTKNSAHTYTQLSDYDLGFQITGNSNLQDIYYNFSGHDTYYSFSREPITITLK